jgi:hypothetical protein
VRWEPEAIYITPPTGADQVLDGTGALDTGRAQSIAFTTASGSPVQLVASGWVTFTADQNVQLRFWRDNTANANQSSDFPLWQYAYMNWVCDGYLWVRAKGMTASGNLYYAPSSR